MVSTWPHQRRQGDGPNPQVEVGLPTLIVVLFRLWCSLTDSKLLAVATPLSLGHRPNLLGWTIFGEFWSTPSRSGVGSETRPLREAMLSETTQSSFPLANQKLSKLYSLRIRLAKSSPTSRGNGGSRAVLKI
jgi:hypothetical protein